MDGVALLTGAGGLLAFLLAMARLASSDRSWKRLLDELRKELVRCTEEKATLHTENVGLRAEIAVLRNKLHTDQWQGGV
ncbi:MAG: hypothetical protein ACRDZ3_20800 [Acidimicrobiia bacterium]